MYAMHIATANTLTFYLLFLFFLDNNMHMQHKVTAIAAHKVIKQTTVIIVIFALWLVIVWFIIK